MTDGFKLTLLWLCAALAALVVALAPVASAFINGEYVPIGPDGFYHARRILDAAADPSAFYQFDSRMHVPEGSLITWPWAYDFAMSLLVRVGLALHLAASGMAVLVHIPVAAFLMALLLVLAICRALSVSTAGTLLAMMGTALFPLNQTLYGIGNIDHHFAEHLFVLGTIAATLNWLRNPQSRAAAVTAGLTFGLASGVHSALFALQLPLLGTLLLVWARGQALPAHVRWFAGCLVGSQLLVALPSLALQRGQFDYYTLSWFQVYAAGCTAALVLLLARMPRSTRGVSAVVAVSLLLALPALSQIALAGDFFTNSIAGMDDISEVRSPLELWRDTGNFAYPASLYTWLLALLPLTVLLCAWRLWRSHEAAQTHFWLVSLSGLAMLTAQVRLQYFGSFALYLPWIVWLSQRTAGQPRLALAANGAAAVVLAAAYLPGLMSYAFQRQPLAGDANYALLRPMYAQLSSRCAQVDGVVLADPDDGHYLRFHTQCSVIANNFLVTSQHARKVQEEERLLSLEARELRSVAPGVRYVFVRHANMLFMTPQGELIFDPKEVPGRPNYPLVRELLAADADDLPPGFHQVFELRTDSRDAPFARLFAVDGATARQPAP